MLKPNVVSERARYFDFSRSKWKIALDLKGNEVEYFYPLMNYIYPLPQHFENDMEERFGANWREKIKDKLVNMTIVLINDEYYLALTGGGMDLSWEICETYINLGYLPPVEFCNLPLLAGKNHSSEKNKRIIEACLESCRLAEDRIRLIKYNLEKLKKQEVLK